MSEVVRLYQYKSILSAHGPVPATELMRRLEISKATLTRDIAKLRDQLHVPIRFDKERGGYVLDGGHTDSELPGLWFSDQEILALVTIQQLLAQLAPGLLGPKLQPLRDRLEDLMAKHGLQPQEVSQRIRLIHAGKRKLRIDAFEAVAAATMGRKRLRVTHFNRQRGEKVTRDISPQRLVHYRDNWYVEAWCHLREDLRAFSVDALSDVHVLESGAKEVSEKTLDQTFGAGYGIFTGVPTNIAVLKFSPARARWVRREQWHPQQEGRDEADGSYVLSVPYSDDRELLGDILRFGPEVQTLQPPELREKTQEALLKAIGRYLGQHSAAAAKR